MQIITRSEWGARYADGFGDRPLPARLLVLHHSVTVAPDVQAPYDDDDAAVRTIERIGQTRFGGGIPYPWLITPSGRIYQGLSPQRRGAHLKGHNTDAVSICLVGDYTSTPATVAQVSAFGQLVPFLVKRGWLDQVKLDGGHRDFAATLCPGDRVYADLGRFRAALELPTVPAPALAPKRQGSPNLLPLFPLPRGHYFGTRRADPACHSGALSNDVPHVRRVQDALRRRGWRLAVDGTFGPHTMQVVGAFQRDKGLAVDGLVGVVTWAAIDNLPVTRG